MSQIFTLEQLNNIVRGFMPARVILTAVYTDVFTKIGDKRKSAGNLAGENDWDKRATRILLDALCALGLLNKDKQFYSNTRFSNSFLRRDKKDFAGWGTLHRNTMWLGWSNLTAIVTKKPFERPSNLLNEEFNNYFINAMWQFHYDEGLHMTRLLDIQNVERMVDLAGGSGSHSIAFAQKNSKLASLIVDLPNSLEVARQKIKEHELEDRISTKECDLFEDQWNFGENYDFALISHLFHSATESQCKNLLKKVYPILRAGGRVIINEVHIDDTKTKPLEGALFTVNMLVHTEGGDTYPQNQIKKWLADSGFEPSAINNNLTAGLKK